MRTWLFLFATAGAAALAPATAHAQRGLAAVDRLLRDGTPLLNDDTEQVWARPCAGATAAPPVCEILRLGLDGAVRERRAMPGTPTERAAFVSSLGAPRDLLSLRHPSRWDRAAAAHRVRTHTETVTLRADGDAVVCEAPSRPPQRVSVSGPFERAVVYRAGSGGFTAIVAVVTQRTAGGTAQRIAVCEGEGDGG